MNDIKLLETNVIGELILFLTKLTIYEQGCIYLRNDNYFSLLIFPIGKITTTKTRNKNKNIAELSVSPFRKTNSKTQTHKSNGKTTVKFLTWYRLFLLYEIVNLV